MRSPLFKAQATLLPAAQRPRLVPGWRPVISPIVDGKSDISAPALGIAFADGPAQAEIGRSFHCAFHLLAWPDPLCGALFAGVEFALLEGTSVVGTGTVVAVEPTDGA